jgi:DNA gyrase inhibitor GyrI
MMMHLLGNQKTTQEELQELKQWIEEKEKGGLT